MDEKLIAHSSYSGVYSSHECRFGNLSMRVSHMPEDNFSIQIVCLKNGEAVSPKIKMDLIEAELLCRALNAVGKDLDWAIK